MYAGRKIEEGSVDDVLLEPRHPYTRGLLDCVLQVEHDPSKFSAQALPEIPGVVPPLDQLGKGCSFAPRCALVMDKCRKEQPPMLGRPGRGAACWRLDGAAAAHAADKEVLA
jgi:oligopeptide/dipeptide ABC transporter ATP-binding protein